MQKNGHDRLLKKRMKIGQVVRHDKYLFVIYGCAKEKPHTNVKKSWGKKADQIKKKNKTSESSN